MFSFLSSLSRLLISPRLFKPLLVIGLACVIFIGGWQVRDWQCEATVSRIEARNATNVAQAHKQARAAEKRLQQASDDMSELQQQLKDKRGKLHKAINIEVQAYEDNSDHVNLPAGWGLLHNRIACRVSGASEATCDALRPPGIVRDDQALKTVADNYVQKCGKWRDQVLGWQAFYERLEASQAPER